MARATATSFFDTTTNLWSDAFLAERGEVILTMRTTTTDDNIDDANNDDVVLAFLVGTGD